MCKSDDPTSDRRFIEQFSLTFIVQVAALQLVDAEGLTTLLETAISLCNEDSQARWQLREMLAEVRWLGWPLS